VIRFALFYHSVVSDWNHGNAHFLRGLVRALQARGHGVTVYEQVDNWSLQNLLETSPSAVDEFKARFPDIHFERYALDDGTDKWLSACVRDADVVIVHEWNTPEIIRRLGELCAEMRKPSLFHDTHYRVVLDDDYRARLGLETFTHILAFSPSVADRYRRLRFDNAVVLHEAADITVFFPEPLPLVTDVVFIGNYGDGDRSHELEDYVFGPRADFPGLKYSVYGVRYPEHVVARLNNGLSIDYGGWLPNIMVPSVYSSARLVLHVPRRQYVELLTGTPTIRVFEALACAACLISLPWPDSDHLFTAGEDFAVAHSPSEMRELIAWLSEDDAARERFGQQGRRTILDRHTCGHRADQLLGLLGA
jgi:spore maturation protein CgeB